MPPHLNSISLHSRSQPRIPLFPVLNGGAVLPCSKGKWRSISDSPFTQHLTSGRVALAQAFIHAGISESCEVLLPAYHCKSMVSPVRWRTAEPIFYRLNKDLSIDMEDLVNKTSSRTRVLIVVHYFGFPQDLQSLRTFCEQRQLILIEDCAHAFFSGDDEKMGTIGDYTIASSMKFYPILDGGCLASYRHDLNALSLRSPNWKYELKAVVNIIEKAISYDRCKLLGVVFGWLIGVKDFLWKVYKRKIRQVASQVALAPPSSEGADYLDPAWVDVRASRVSRAIIAASCAKRIAEKRRFNFNLLKSGLCGLPGSKLLFDELPPGVVPLYFPLYINSPDVVFSRLMEEGVPIKRFGEELDSGVTQELCSVSVDYSKHLFQVPCHDGLRKNELNWMVERIREILVVL